MRELLAAIDERVTAWLLAHPAAIPLRWAKFLAYYYPDARVRKEYLRVLKVEMGEGSFANAGFMVTTDPRVAGAQVRIGNRVSIGPGVLIICDSRPNNSPMLSAVPYVAQTLVQSAPVNIEDDVWIGAGAIVLPGVRIGRGAIVGAGAVVLVDVPSFHVVAGVPARVVRTLDVPPPTLS